MADNTQFYGFRPYQSRNNNTEKPERYRVASAYQGVSNGINVDLRPGDPVKKVNDGTVALVAAGDATFGIIVHIEPYFDGAKMVKGQALPGGTTYGSVLERQSFVEILPLEGVIFEVCVDDNTTATTEAAYNAFIGENCDITMNGVSGSKFANPLLDISTHNTTNTLVWRIVDLSRRPGIDFTGLNVPLLVTGNVIQQAPDQPTGI